MKQPIDNISSSFCLAKWLQVTLHLQNGYTHSCHHPNKHKIPLEELENNPSALHNTIHKKEARKQMMEGERPPECEYCWKIEDLPGNNVSDRYLKSADAWAAKHIDRVANSDPSEDINPTYMEVSFSNVCNFKCSYCSPVHSSQWVHDMKKNDPGTLEWFKSTGEMPIHHKEHNPYVDAFWEWFPELVKELEVFRITGGEPLLDKNTFKVLDYLYDNPQPHLEINVNSNLCVPTEQIDLYIEKTKRLLDEGKIRESKMYTSVDGYGKQAEYGRYGLDYDQWLANVNKVLTELPHRKVAIMCTANIFSITSFLPLLEDVLVLKKKYDSPKMYSPVTINMTILRWPERQCVDILPAEYADLMLPALDFMKSNRQFMQYEVVKLERFIQSIKNQPTHDVSMHRKKFYDFVNAHDEQYHLNFLEIFPQLTDFYNLCSDKYSIDIQEIQ